MTSWMWMDVLLVLYTAVPYHSSRRVKAVVIVIVCRRSKNEAFQGAVGEDRRWGFGRVGELRVLHGVAEGMLDGRMEGVYRFRSRYDGGSKSSSVEVQ